nr:phage regulatory CII family protein [Mesorhizobium sp. RMAD-H1]
MKAATGGAYELAGGISRILDFTRVSTSPLSKYASFGEEHAESFAPIDVAIEIDRRAKSPVIVKEMAALLGYQLTPVTAQAADKTPLTEMDAHRVLSETMDLSRAILDALLDGRIDALERKTIAREARETMRAIESVLARIEVQA